MSRTLLVTAGAGLAIAVACFALAGAIGGDDWSDLFFGGHFCGPASDEGIRENTREFAWRGGTRVSINVPAAVRYRPGPGTKLTVSGPADVLGHLRVDDGRVSLNCRNLLRGRQLEIELPGVPFREFRLNGSGRLTLEDIDQPTLRLRLNGANDVKATGKSAELDIAIRGTGKADLGGLAVQRAEISIAGAGEAELSPEERAEVTIAGAGLIRFLRQPAQLETHIAGSGRIINAPSL